MDVIALREPQPENRVEKGGGDRRLKEALQRGSSQTPAHSCCLPQPTPRNLPQKTVGLLAKTREDESDQGLNAGFGLTSGH